MIGVGESIWCGVANRIYVIDAQNLEVRVSDILCSGTTSRLFYDRLETI
jgi:hypothetical protein